MNILLEGVFLDLLVFDENNHRWVSATVNFYEELNTN
jgi:hypothetical protein